MKAPETSKIPEKTLATKKNAIEEHDYDERLFSKDFISAVSVLVKKMASGQNEEVKVEVSKYLDSIRSVIKDENDLLNQRMTWMFTFNGFLFTGLGIAFFNNSALSVKLPYVLLISVLGFLTSASYGYTISRALHAINIREEEACYVIEKLGYGSLNSPVIGRRTGASKWITFTKETKKSSYSIPFVRKIEYFIRYWIPAWRMVPLLISLTWLTVISMYLFWLL